MELIDQILSQSNLKEAIKRVKANKGAAGVDKRTIYEIDDYFKKHQVEIKQSIRAMKYKPQAVRRVYIPKANGKKRPLGIPTVVDRVIQQAISQVLMKIYDPEFSAYSYGFRPKRSSHDAMEQVLEYLDEGYQWVIDLDIEKYFDTYDANDKAFALFDKLRDYTIFTTDNNNCVSLFEWLDSVRVIDLTLYPDDTKKVIVSLILDLFYAEMRQLGGSRQENGFRELRAMIMVDEAHQFLKKDFNSFRSIISEGRMFGVGMILSTQNISDFKTSKEDYSQFVLSWIIHHVNSISKSEIASIFGASDSNGDKYMDFINKAKLFESVCKIGSRVEGIRDEPFFELIQNDERFSKES